jgi:hypothetical protein
LGVIQGLITPNQGLIFFFQFFDIKKKFGKFSRKYKKLFEFTLGKKKNNPFVVSPLSYLS